MNLKKIFAVILAATFVATSISPIANAATVSGGSWVAGDFHTHTNLSDGSYPAAAVAKKAFVDYKLDWYSAADHGGATKGIKKDDGSLWNADSSAVPRWDSMLGEGSDKIKANNDNYPNNLQFNGFEWNVPGHEHASVGIIGTQSDVKSALSAFDYMFDSEKEKANNLLTSLGYVQANSSHDNAAYAAGTLENDHATTSYFLPNHPSRRLQYDIASLRDFNSAAPDVCFGFEGVPGHQKSPYRGGYAYVSYYDTTAKKQFSYTYTSEDKSLSDLVGRVVKEAADANAKTANSRDTEAKIRAAITESTVAKQRTYGGADYMAAKVGGTWDSLLAEGRKFWIFGNSDFHTDTGSEPDFWPGEYTKNYTYAASKTFQGVLDGMRSGKTFVETGDLINALDYKITNNSKIAEMGETLAPTVGQQSILTIRFKAPATNNNTYGASNTTPAVDHIDLIAGKVTGQVDPFQPVSDTWVPGDPTVANPVYNQETSDAKVIKTFKKSDWTVDAEGYSVITFTLPATNDAMFYRLRGTNLAPNTAGETDADGNPLIDVAVNATTGTNTAAAAFSDLWFYSNPIFLSAPESPAPTVVKATSIKLNKAKVTLKKNKKVTLKITIKPTNTTDKSVTWSTSNKKVATVSNGVVKAKKLGKATITAKTANGKTYKCTITVKK